MKAQTFWRYHAKPRVCPTRRLVVQSATPGTVAGVRELMRDVAASAVAAGCARPAFPFDPAEVAAVYTAKRHEGQGVWFALIDGRVINSAGELDSTDPDEYDVAS